jgi:acyl dehydratase
MPQLYWDTVDLGDPVAPLTKPAVTRVQIAKFAGAAQEWSPLHLDDDFAKTAGYGGVFAHGALTLGFAVEGVQKWLENGRVLASQATFQKLVWPGDVLTAKGVVVGKNEKNGELRIDIDVWTENQNHDIVMKGQVTCLLWRTEKDEKRNKGFPPVSSATIDDRRTAKPIPKTEADQARAREAQQQQERKAAPPPRSPPPRPTAPVPVKPVPTAKPALAAPVAKQPPPVKQAPAAKQPPPKAAPSKPVATKAPVKAVSKPAPVKAASKPAAVKPVAKPAPAKPAAKKPVPKPAPKAPAKPAKAPAKPATKKKR